MPSSKYPKNVQKLPAKKERQWGHIYKSARGRDFSKERAAKQAWGGLDENLPELPSEEKGKPSIEILLRILKEKGMSLPLIQKKYLAYMTDLDLKSRVDQQFGSFGNWLLHSGKPTKAKGVPRLTQLKHKIGETDMKKEDYDMEESTQYPSGKPEYPDVVKEDEDCAGMDEDYVEETTKYPSNKGKYPDTYLKTKVREHKISMSEWFNIGEGKKKSAKSKKKAKK